MLSVRPALRLLRQSSWTFVLGGLIGGSLLAQSEAQLARQALEQGEYKRAEALYRSLLHSSPSSPELLNNLGVALHYQGKSSEAIQALEKAPRNQDYIHAIEQARQNSSPDANAARALALKTRPYLRPGMSIQEMALLLPQHGNDAALLYMLGVVCGEQAMQAFLLCEKQ